MSFNVEKVTHSWLFIVDNNDGLSVTNDAENVCEALALKYGNKRIMYRDTEGQWDELVHNHGIFKRFEYHGYTDYDIDRLITLESVTL